MPTLSKNENDASTPYPWFDPGAVADTERFVTMAPTLLRRRMSRFTRTTLKLVGSVADVLSSPVWMFITPSATFPTLPVKKPQTKRRLARPNRG